jgi:hypothetical protein
MSWNKWESAAERGPGALMWKVIGFVVFFSIVIGGIGFVANPFRQGANIINKTIDADNVIYNYEWFKQRHEDIGAIDTKIVQADKVVEQFKEDAGPRPDWHREDREESARLSSVAMGLKQQKADLAAEYNARSRMVNRSIFKAGDVTLPESIPTE